MKIKNYRTLLSLAALSLIVALNVSAQPLHPAPVIPTPMPPTQPSLPKPPSDLPKPPAEPSLPAPGRPPGLTNQVPVPTNRPPLL